MRTDDVNISSHTAPPFSSVGMVRRMGKSGSPSFLPFSKRGGRGGGFPLFHRTHRARQDGCDDVHIHCHCHFSVYDDIVMMCSTSRLAARG